MSFLMRRGVISSAVSGAVTFSANTANLDGLADLITIPQPQILDESFSFSFDLVVDTIGSLQHALISNGAGVELDIRADGRLQFYLYTGAVFTSVASVVTLTSGEHHQICIQFSTTTGGELIVDGVSANNASMTTHIAFNSLSLGGRAALDLQFQGSVSNFSHYTAVRSLAQINALHNNGNTLCYELQDKTNLLGSWPLANWNGQAIGSELIDKHGTTNATTTGNVTYTDQGVTVSCTP